MVPLYGVQVRLVVAVDMNAAVKDLGGDAEADDEAEAWTVPMGGARFGLVFSAVHLTHGQIAHELSHLVDFIFEHIGHTPAVSGDESRSYLADWLADWTYCQLADCEITSTHAKIPAH